jgi:2-keto-4-pentenoate hydratase
MDKAHVAEAARLLLRARETRTLFPELPPECKPQKIEDTLEILDVACAQISEPIGGWKVSAKPDQVVCYAPIYRSRIYKSGGKAPINQANAFFIETEISFRLLNDLPPRSKPFEYGEIAEAVEAFPTFEIVDCHYSNHKSCSMLEIYADFMVNGGFVCGEPIKNFRQLDFPNLHITINQGKKLLCERRGGHPNTDPLLPVVVLANQFRTGRGLERGEIVATGSFTGAHNWMPGAGKITSTIDGVGEIEITIE